MGEFSGIDPKALPQTIGSISTDVEKLRNRGGWIKSQFVRFGIDTQPLTDLLAIAQWADDQVPMLRRRQHLAIAADQPYPGFTGMVSIDESKVGQAAEAAKQGKTLGDTAKKSLEDGDAISPEVFAALEQHADDADYIKAFYDTLGPTYLAWQSSSMSDHMNDYYKTHPDELEKNRKLLARTLGVYTQVAFEGQDLKTRTASWNKWFDALALDPKYQGYRPDLLMPLLDGGTYDKDFLVALGDRTFAAKQRTNENQFMGPGGMGAGAWSKDHYAQLFEALAKNPDVSATWFDHNYDDVQKMLYPAGPWRLDEPQSRADAFFKVATAATVTERDSDPALAEKNTARLLNDNYLHMKNPDNANWHPIKGTQQLYAAIITSYWKDLEYSVTSPTGNILWGEDTTAKGEEKLKNATAWDPKAFLGGQDGSRPGLEAAPKLWQAMMVESARDPKAAGTLSALFQAYDVKMNQTLVDTRTDNLHGESYTATKKGLMQQFYVQSFKETTTQLEGDLDKWVEDTNAFREGLIDNAVTIAGGAAGGAGLAGAKDSAMGIAVDFGTEMLTSWIKQGVHVNAKDAPKDLKDGFTKVDAAKADFSWRTDYRNMAAQLLADGYDPAKFDTVTVQGTNRSYNGDPKKYITGPAADFLDAKGNVLPEDKMSPEQRTAYGNWLEDPSVAATIWQDFSDSRNARDWPGQDN